MTKKTVQQADAKLQTVHNAGVIGTGLETGTIKALVTEREAMITLSSGEQIHAVQSASCLLAPVIEDTVLVYRGPEQSFILSVLTRTASVTAEIGVPDAKDVAMKAKGRLALSAPDVNVSARRMTVVAENLMQSGKQIVSNFGRALGTYADKIVNARTITTTAQSRSSSVKETETLKAGILVQSIDSVATQNSEISMITAEEDVRLDAKRVSVG